MMTIRLLNFGITREILNTKSCDLELNAEKLPLSELKKHLEKRYPALKELKSLSFAVDEEYVDEKFLVREGSEIALIPPLSGG